MSIEQKVREEVERAYEDWVNDPEDDRSSVEVFIEALSSFDITEKGRGEEMERVVEAAKAYSESHDRCDIEHESMEAATKYIKTNNELLKALKDLEG